MKSIGTEVMPSRNEARERGDKKTCLEIKEGRTIPFNNRTTETEIKRKDKVEIDGLQAR